MITLAHGLWGAAISPSKDRKSVTQAVVYSMLPDLIWLPFMGLYLLLGHSIPHSWADAPVWFFVVYNLAHSLIIWITAFTLTWLIIKKIPWQLIYYLLHIVIDIVGHQHFTTAFLFPLSNFQFHSWFSWETNPYLWLSLTLPIIVIGIRYTVIGRKDKPQT